MEFLKLQQTQNAEFWAEYRRELMAEYMRAAQPETIAEIQLVEQVVNDEVDDMIDEDFNAFLRDNIFLEPEEEEEQFRILYMLDYTTVNGALRNARYRQIDNNDLISREHYIQNIVYFINEIGGNDIRGTTVLYTDERGESYFRTITGSTYEELEVQIFMISGGESIHGSDVVSESYSLDTSTFFIKYITHPTVAAKNTSYKATDLTYYKIADYKGDAGDCLLNVLRNVRALDNNIYNKNLRKLLNLPDGNIACSPDNLQNLADFFKVNIEAYSEDIEEVEPIKFVDDPKRGNRVHYELRHCRLYDIKCHCVDVAKGVKGGVPLAKGPNPTAHILIKNEHCSHILKFKDIQICPYTGDLEIRNNEKELRKRVLEQYRTYYGCKKVVEKKEKIIKKYNVKILVYDIETIFETVKGVLMPYAVGWYIFDVNREDADFSKEEAKMAFGFDCMEKLVKEIAIADENTKYIITSFNGARFDNFILAQALAKKEMLNDVFFTSNQIRDIRTGCHNTLDLCKLCPMTLKDACSGFQTSPIKVEGFDHALPQSEYMNNNFNNWLVSNKEKLDKYLSGDVLSTCSLAVKLIKNLKEITGINPFLSGNSTIASLAWAAFNNNLDEKERELKEECKAKAAKDDETDKFIRKGVIGGRTQNFENAGFMSNEPSYMVDVCSLYPSVMAAANVEYMPDSLLYGHYPIGEETKTREYIPDHLGIYNVKIISQPTPNIIPLREVDKPHNWNYKGEIETTISSVSIELIRHYGGVVEVYDGIYYRKKSRDMFKSFLDPIIAIKSREDKNKNDNNPDYNKALRETTKLIMNSLSGKPAQKNYDDLAILCKGAAKQIAGEKKFIDNKAPKWYSISGEVCLLVGKKEVKYDPKKSMPVCLSVFIYEHARSYMYHLIYNKYKPIYTDTDSAILRAVDYFKFREDYPRLDPEPENRLKILGDVETELYPCEGQKMVICQPKAYYINGLDEKGEKIVKAKIKGVNYKADKYITNRKKADIMDNYSLETLHKLYTGEIEDSQIQDLKDPYELFRNLAINKNVSILCSSLRKGLDPKEGFIIKQVYQIKNLVLDKDAREEIKERYKNIKMQVKRINQELIRKLIK